MLDYIKIMRPFVFILVVFGVVVAALISGVTDPYLIGLASIIVFLISGAGNALNDYFDYDIDKINRPERPIPSGKLKRSNVLMFSLALLGIGIILSTFLNIYCMLLALFNSVFIIVYNRYLKRMVIGHFLEAWLQASVLIFGGLLALNLNPLILFLASIAYISNVGREITKGIEDYTGDKKSDAKTFAVTFGKNKARFAAIFFVLLTIALLPFPYIMGIANMYYVYVISISAILLLASIVLIFKKVGLSQRIMKLAMFFGIIAFLATIL